MKTEGKLDKIKRKANMVDKEVFAEPNIKSKSTGGTLICLPKIYKDQPKFMNEDEDGFSIIAFTDFDNRKKVIVSIYFKYGKMRTIITITNA